MGHLLCMLLIQFHSSTLNTVSWALLGVSPENRVLSTARCCPQTEKQKIIANCLTRWNSTNFGIWDMGGGKRERSLFRSWDRRKVEISRAGWQKAREKWTRKGPFQRLSLGGRRATGWETMLTALSSLSQHFPSSCGWEVLKATAAWCAEMAWQLTLSQWWAG